MNRDRELRAALTYREIGATALPQLPTGYRQIHRSRQLGNGPACFAEAAEMLTSWDMHRRAGVRVDADAPAHLDQTVGLVVGLGPFQVKAPARVVYLVEEANRRGFAYGTLPSHPEIGEERFTVSIDAAGAVWAEIRAFSRPGRWFTKLASPLARRVQDVITNRYLDALRPDHPCPCCGNRTLTIPGDYELCPVCFWEDDPNQFDDPESTAGANGKSLVDARRTYLLIGAMDHRFLNEVRPAYPQ